MGCPIERRCQISCSDLLSASFHRPDHFLLRDRQTVKERLHRRLAVAPAALMVSLLVVFNQPGIEIGLQLRNRQIYLLAECHAIKLIQDRLVEALADAVGLRASRFRPRVIDVLDRQIQLIGVTFRLAAT